MDYKKLDWQKYIDEQDNQYFAKDHYDDEGEYSKPDNS